MFCLLNITKWITLILRFTDLYQMKLSAKNIFYKQTTPFHTRISKYGIISLLRVKRMFWLFRKARYLPISEDRCIQTRFFCCIV